MSLYEIRYTKRADRDLSKLPPEIAREVIRKIHTLRDEPYRFIKKVQGSNPGHPIYSLRIGRAIRAFLSLHDDVLIIHVLEVEQRKSAYRDF